MSANATAKRVAIAEYSELTWKYGHEKAQIEDIGTIADLENGDVETYRVPVIST